MTHGSLELYKRGTRNVLWLTVREGRRFILKGLPEDLRGHMEETARLRKEYSLGLRINHPGVVGVYGFENHPEAGPVIVMEYVEGLTLDEFLKKQQPLKIRRAVARQIADALSYIHSLGLSHRDLKPDNVLVTRRNEAKIIDIGLGDSEDSVVYKQSMGTERFGAPEQQMPCVGDARADVYSFGKLLELLLPESRFRKLRASCLQANPDKRISMEEAAEMLGNERKGGILGWSIVVGCVLMAVIVTVGIIGWRNSAKETPMPDEKPVEFENNIDAAVETLEETGIEEKQVESSREVPMEKRKESVAGEQPMEPVLDHENKGEEATYEKIYDKYMAEVYREINRLGRGYDVQRGEYVDSIVLVRARVIPDIMNRMVNELTEAGCTYDELSFFTSLMFDNSNRAVEKIDGIRN